MFDAYQLHLDMLNASYTRKIETVGMSIFINTLFACWFSTSTFIVSNFGCCNCLLAFCQVLINEYEWMNEWMNEFLPLPPGCAAGPHCGISPPPRFGPSHWIFTALHGMQTRSSDEISVCPSVKRVHCDKTEEKSIQIFIPCERSFSLVLWEEEWLVGGDPLYQKFWVNRPALERNRRFWTNNRS